MFEQFFGGQNQQLKAELDSEKRQINLNREMASINTSSAEHQAYLEEQERKVDLIKWQQELDTEPLKHKLRNETFDVETGKWIKKTHIFNGERISMASLMTEEGIAALENAIFGFVGENAKNLINSSLDEKQISKALIFTANDCVHIIEHNFDRYFVEPTPSNFTLAMRIIKNEIKPTPFRALKGFTKKQDNTAIKRVETFSEQAQQEKKKMFGIV